MKDDVIYILADNQDITRIGLMALLNVSKEDKVHEVKSKKGLVALLQRYTAAVVILDYTLFDIESMDELFILKDRFGGVEWLLFSDELSPDFIHRVLNHGFGVLMKDSPKEEIQTALLYLSQRKRYICQQAGSLLFKESTHSPVIEEYALTPSEKVVLKEISLGKTTKEIAIERNLSFHTINSHRKNIFRKIGVNNVHEATKYAMRAGIIDIAEYCI